MIGTASILGDDNIPKGWCAAADGAETGGNTEKDDEIKFCAGFALSAARRAMSIWNIVSKKFSEIMSAGIILGSAGVIGFALNDEEEDDIPITPGWAAIADLDLVECAIPETGAMS